MATTVGQILEQAGAVGNDADVLVGGYFGVWLAASEARTTPFSVEGLAPFGVGPGAGLVLALSRAYYGLAETAKIVDWLAGQSSGQCGPCVHGLRSIADALTVVGRPSPRVLDTASRILGWCEDVKGRGACHHPDGVVGLVRSSLRVFSEEAALHQEGRCSAVVRRGAATAELMGMAG